MQDGYAQKWGDKKLVEMSLEEWEEFVSYLMSHSEKINKLLMKSDLEKIEFEIGGKLLETSKNSYRKEQEEKERKKREQEEFYKTPFGQRCKVAQQIANKLGSPFGTWNDSRTMHFLFAPQKNNK